jgi:hypothetical protein
MSRVFLGSSVGCCFGDIYVGGASGIVVKKDNTLSSQEALDVAGTTLFK